MTSTPVTESQNRYAALSVEECDDNNNDTDTTSSALNAKAEQEAESLSTRPLLTLGQTNAKRHTSSLHGETQPTKVLDGKSPTTVTPIDSASLPHATDGTTSKPKGELYEASSKNGQAAQTERSPTPKVGVESRLGGETTARLPGQQ
ncbi:uncharacterized protein ARMOST_13850 [Armillaria ostoyae]|uniref:Uncharacterized protein n=1 Tax=Armillaria ostoyae TaxID=47428 RepID=A0A284RP11_ARMOS|nr:uncharacterized protein ARMOST_13850 [Armillaria ostoyae]